MSREASGSSSRCGGALVRTEGSADDALARADGVVISTPGYHGGISGLLKNALDAHRGLDAPLAVVCRVSRREGQVCVAVEDAGPPLSPADRARLFEPFFTTKPEGLGLGLTICRGIVESHGGSLLARALDPDGKRGGMIFEVWLPLDGTSTVVTHKEGPA